MAHYVTDRIVVGLSRTAGVLCGLGALGVAAAIGWTTTEQDLIRVVIFTAVAFVLPAGAIWGVALWLDAETEKLEGRSGDVAPIPRDEAALHPFREPITRYIIGVAAALAAWGVRALLDPYLPGYVPFITFFLGVAVAGWLGGYGPAVLATAISACIARYFYMAPTQGFSLVDLGTSLSVALFVLSSLVIGGLTAALHAALLRVQFLANELSALKGKDAIVPHAMPARGSTVGTPFEAAQRGDELV